MATQPSDDGESVVIDGIRGGSQELESAGIRARRSILCCPGDDEYKIRKAATSAADCVLLDLEDSISPDHKEQARRVTCDAVRDLDFGHRIVSVRINSPETADGAADVQQLVAANRGLLRTLVVPKITAPNQIKSLAGHLDDLESADSSDGRIALEVMIEDVRAVEHLFAIARSAPRIAALSFGPGDYGASQGVRKYDSASRDPGPDPFSLVRLCILTAARAAGIQPVEGPVSADVMQTEALERQAVWSAHAGFEAMWALHPIQIPVINKAFMPTEGEVTLARDLIRHVEAAKQSGSGVVTHNGAVVDDASVKGAYHVLKRAAELKSSP